MKQEDKQYPVLGTPELVAGKTYIISDRAAFVAQSYTVVCPVCGKHLLAEPDKKGLHTLICPNNDSKINYMAKEVKAKKVETPAKDAEEVKKVETPAKETEEDDVLKYPELGVPKLVQGKVYKIKEKAVVGKTYKVICPVCGKVIKAAPDKEGQAILHCPNKDSAIAYRAIVAKANSGNADDQGPVPTQSAHAKALKSAGRLEWGGFFFKKKAKLHVGTNIVGREDAESPSDISFKDEYMSRRSVAIEVQKDSNHSGYNFKLTVLNASNPVYVGSHPLLVGNSIYLNYGDVIKMGNTVLTFKEDK